MIFNETPLRGAFTIELEKRGDDRGFFARVFCEQEFEAHGLPRHFVQVNNSLSAEKGTLRGFHYQLAPKQEDKLVRCIRGALWDAIIDLRHRCREAVERGKQLWGVAHYANYRLALDAPPPIAGPVIGEPRGQLLPGPLTEVLGCRFDWATLAPHLPRPGRGCCQR